MTVDTHMTYIFDAKTEREDAMDFKKHNKSFAMHDGKYFITFDKHLILCGTYEEIERKHDH